MANEVLTLPATPRVRYPQNTIRQLVCELQFPVLPDLAAGPPSSFTKAIRKRFPRHEPGVDVQISVGENGFEQIPSPIHRYRAKGSAGNVWVRPSAIGFETTQYVDFETLSEDVKLLLDAAKPILDSDFFTRIGLRYVNVLPPDASEPSGWVNSKVLGSMGDEALGPLDVHWTQMQGRTDCGQFVFKYGIANIANQGRRYMLDADFFDEGVEWDEAIARLRRFNELNFQLYSWAIGPKTLEWLGKAEPK